MRTTIVSNIMSLDGCYAAADGNPLVLNMDPAFDAYNLERLQSAGTVLLGRASYQMFSSYWPYIADAPADPADRALSPDNRAFSRRYDAVPKVVVSDTYTPPADNPWHDTTTVVPLGDLTAWLADHRQHGDGDIVTFGSRTMWNHLLTHGLVDEVHLMVGPNTVGAGIPALPPNTRLTLLDARTFPGSDNVLHRYARP